MKNSRIVVAVLFVSVLCFTAVNASGENRAGMFSLTPLIGGYVFDGAQDLDNAPVYGAGFGVNYTDTIGVESIFQFIDTESDRTGEDVEGYIYRVDGLYHFMPEKRFVPYIAAGLGLISINGDQREDNTNGLFDYGAGIKYYLNESLALRGDVRHLLDFDGTNNNLLYTVGISYVFGRKAEQISPPPLDSDGDGVNDAADKCPDTPTGVKVDRSGCPLDSDGDGVYDYLDQCPDTPAGVSVDRQGCPIDSDGDGVYDYLDNCPDTPAGAPVDSSGCPLDSDGDGVYDYRDQCPGTPRGIQVDAVGCPVAIKEKVAIELKVEFDFDSANVRSIYDEHIRKVANFLAAYPDTIAVIEGHTDSKGSEAYNLKLSQRRAESVVRNLIGRGMDASRLKAIGYGESRPVADNSTDEGRQRNRRVVAVITTIVTK
jgi:OOP family OmpA-OmpF porin